MAAGDDGAPIKRGGRPGIERKMIAGCAAEPLFALLMPPSANVQGRGPFGPNKLPVAHLLKIYSSKSAAAAVVHPTKNALNAAAVIVAAIPGCF